MNTSTLMTPVSSLTPAGKSPRRAFLQRCALAGTGLILARRAIAAEETPVASVSSDIWDVIKNRRSVRKFKSDAVPEADLRRIVDALRLAPTSGNQQPWKVLIVRDPAKIKQLLDANVQRVMEGQFENRHDKAVTREQFESSVRRRFAEGYFSAPVYIVILTDNQSKYPDYNHWDGPLGVGYLMLAARALGYGTVFITDAISDEVTKKVLNIPDRYTRVCITPLGVPVEWPKSPTKKPLEEFIAWETLSDAPMMTNP